MATGGFIGFAPSSRNNGNAGANSIFLSALTAPQNGTALAVLLDCFSATASTTLKALVYDGAHSVLLASSAQATASVANYNRFVLTAPLSVVAGTTYYVGYVCSTTLPVTIDTGTSWFASGSQSVTTPANPLAAGASNANSLMVALELDGAGLLDRGWSPDQSTAITLSTANTVATSTSAGNQGARSIVTKVPGAGKWYAEVLVAGTLSNTIGIGLGTANWGVGQSVSALRSYVEVLGQAGTLRLPGSTVSLGLTYASGDVLGIAYDAVGNLLWFNKNNGSWFGASSTAGSPAAGTGGAAMQTVQWPVAVMVATNTPGNAAVFTLRDTAGSQQYAAPSGFSSWSAATYPALATARQYAVSLVS